MCGFAGFAVSRSSVRWDPRAVVAAMADSLAHRGPDDSGVWSDAQENVHLGFRRLSILDLTSAGHQPMVSGSGRFVITFNGEIYNFGALREELRGEGVTFKSRSDTETLLEAVERWGVVETLPRLRGMFAFAVWDVRERRLWLARDRLGIKPLYLFRGKSGVAFASESRAFHAFPDFEGRGDAAAATAFLRRLYVPGRMSILAGVEKLAPGEYLRFRVGASGPEEEARDRYWDLRAVASAPRTTLAPPDAVDRLEELLEESVRLRLVADVPVGAFLSGGVDSTLVVSIMQKLATEPVRTFTIGFDDPRFDESPAAAEVAAHLGTRHTSVRFESREIAGLIPTLPGLSDEPMANPSLLPTLLVSRVARNDVVVALSGDGGDELFGGYNRYLHGASLIRRAHRMPFAARRTLGRLCERSWAVAAADLAFRMASPSNVGHQQTNAERMRKVGGVLAAHGHQEAYESLLNVGWPVSGGARNGHSGPDERIDHAARPLEERMMLTDQLDYLPDDLLAKVDRASMWESLEARVPLLDHRVAEFSWTLPLDYKIRDGETKWPLRQIARRYVPEKILDRPKMGFTVPIARWLSSDLREWAGDLLTSQRVGQLGVVDAGAVERAWTKFEGGREDLALPLWTVAVLVSWSDAWKVSFA